MIEVAARCAYPTLILGETGAGKDLVARCVHEASNVRARTMVVAECGGVAESLLESEFFGHEKGAFTGAHASHSGFFERAHGSSLLLDEIDSMSARMQASLLRVLETGEYRPVGAARPRKSEFRLIGAALPRLLTMVEEGQFRKDLFFRISTLRIEIPPLRDRGDDAREIAVAHARSLGFDLTAGGQRAVARYEWPGNVRQLRHCIQAAGLHARDGRIGEAAVSDVIATHRGARAAEKPADGRGLDAAWGRALRTLERMGSFGAWDFAQAADLSRRSAQRHIGQLLRDGRITRLGAGRASRYKLRS
jgi:transcriptional regulator with GAF, ATPase, and Fis domain